MIGLLAVLCGRFSHSVICVCATVALFEAIYNFLSVYLEQIYGEFLDLCSALFFFSFPFLFSLFCCTMNNIAFSASSFNPHLFIDLFLLAVTPCKNYVTHITYNNRCTCFSEWGVGFLLLSQGLGFLVGESNQFWPPSQQILVRCVSS